MQVIDSEADLLVIDTETSGREAEQHRIIEVGIVYISSRIRQDKSWQCYFNPEQAIDPEAEAVHGLSQSFLTDKPLFQQKAEELWSLLAGKTLIIHNAAFDLAFLNAEFTRCGLDKPKLETVSPVIDTLLLARSKYRGARCSLDALCKRFHISLQQRVHHGALLDAELLAEVYLSLTRGQNHLNLQDHACHAVDHSRRFDALKLKKLIVSQSLKKYHLEFWKQLQQESGSWKQDWLDGEER